MKGCCVINSAAPYTGTTSDEKGRGKAIRQIIASFIVNIGPMNTGLIFGFSAVCLPQLLAPTSSIQIDHNQASWIGKFSSCLLLKIKIIVLIFGKTNVNNVHKDEFND